MTTGASGPIGPGRSTGWLPFTFILVVAFPLIAGTLRLIDLAGGPAVLPANPRMTDSPVPVFVHVTGAMSYAVLGAFQFSSRLRRRNPRRHRALGKVVIVSGMAVALSGLWMTLVYPQQPGTGILAYLFRLVFGSALAVALASALMAIRRGDVPAHRAWMMRGFAIALAAGTQTVTLAVGPALFGPSVVTKDLSLGSAWIINLAVAEALILRDRVPRVSRLRSKVSTP